MKTLILLLISSLPSFGQFVVGYIGDSITAGYTSSPQVYPGSIAAANLNTYTGTSLYSAVNQGTPGTTSGSWVAPSAYLSNALSAFSAAHVNWISIMLGTNDAGYGISSSIYTSNMQSVIASLEAAGYTTIILNYPPYMTTNSFGFNPATANPLLLQYQADLQAIAAADPHVHIGDTTAFTFFQANQSLLGDGLHPNNAGYAQLGQFWATALEQLFLTTTRCVGNVTATACGHTYSTIQSAYNAASYGDTIVIAHGQTFTECLNLAGKPGYTPGASITFTTDVPNWLPGPNSRVTLSDIPNMPTIACGGDQPISLYRASAGIPASGIHFIGVRAKSLNTYSTGGPFIYTDNYDYGLLHGGPGAPTSYADLPTDLVCDRCILDQDLSDTTSVAEALVLETRAATIRNSWLYNFSNYSQESHTITAKNASGPWTITNNMMVVTSTSILTGGAQPDVPNANPGGIVGQYNFVYRPYKWWYTTINPHPDWYAYEYAHNNYGGVGGGTGCMKNAIELKKTSGILWQYNVHELMGGGPACLSQSYSVVMNAKEDTPCGYLNCSGHASAPTTTSFAWDTAINKCGSDDASFCVLIPGNMWCMSFPVASQNYSQYTCQSIATVDNTARTGTITGTWPGITSGFTSLFLISRDATASFSNAVFDSNLFRNYWGGPSMLGVDSAYGPGNGGILYNVSYTNNLSYQTIQLCGDPSVPCIQNASFRYYPGSVGFGPNISGGSHINYLHNTWDYCCGNAPAWIYMSDQTQSPQPGIQFTAYPGGQVRGDHMFVASNLFYPAANAPLGTSGGCGGHTYDVGTCIAEEMTSNAIFANNTIPWATMNTCAAGQNCTGNFLGAYTPKFIPGTYLLSAASPYSKGGLDGADLGANPGLVPQIKNLKVTASAQTALLEFDLTAPIQDAGNTQPCVLEVSSTMFYGFPALSSYLSPYTTTNDLNPAYFLQATASNRTNSKLLNPVVSGGHVYWPIGQSATVAGDDGGSHDLRLTAGTNYYARLMCYGDTQHFQFATLGSASGVTWLPMQFVPPTGETGVAVHYGATPALGASVTGAASSGKATVSVPVTAGNPLYYQVTYTGAATLTQPLAMLMP